jgi:hypothetical protein
MEFFGLDVLSATYLSKMVNVFDKNVAADSETITAFVKLFRVGDALLELGDVLGLTSLIKAGEEMKALEDLEIPRISPTRIKIPHRPHRDKVRARHRRGSGLDPEGRGDEGKRKEESV